MGYCDFFKNYVSSGLHLMVAMWLQCYQSDGTFALEFRGFWTSIVYPVAAPDGCHVVTVLPVGCYVCVRISWFLVVKNQYDYSAR